MIAVAALEGLCGLSEKESHATALAIMLPLTGVSSVVYAMQGAIPWGTLAFVAPGLAIGSLVGARLTGKLSDRTLCRLPLLTLALGVGQQEAQGVNMLAFLPGAILALWVHKRAGRVSFKGCWPMLLLGVLGSALGALAAGWIQTAWLKRLFGLFLMVLGLLQWKRGKAASGRN